jgi:hypothetical protein
VCLLLLLFLPVSGAGQPLTIAAGDAPAPEELAPPVRALLAPGSTTVQSGNAVLEFWWVKSFDGDSAGKGWSGVPEGTLAGAVRVSESYPDIRGRRIKPGVYTLRFALQPMNGDHLGVSPYREFLLVCPARADTNPAPAGHQGAVELSRQTTGASHPAVWSIDPPSATGEPLRVMTNDEGHHAAVFRIQNLTFGLILIGKIEA